MKTKALLISSLPFVALALILSTTRVNRETKAIASGLAVVAALYKPTNEANTNEDGNTPTQANKPAQALSDVAITQLATEANKFPHVMVIGKTGSGKSTIAQALASLTQGLKFAIAPHLDPSKRDEEWRGCNGVFCGGRNYGGEDDEDITYDDLINNRVPNATAYQVLKSLLGEMDRRYKSEQGFESHEFHDWFVDETPAIARALDKNFGKLVSPQAYEARKVRIRLWIITQSDNVRTLKLEGEGKVRDNFTYLYLGSQAKTRATNLINKGLLDERFLKYTSDMRFAVVDDVPSLVPDIGELNTWIDGSLPSERFVQWHTEPTIPTLPKPLPRTPEDIRLHSDLLERILIHGLDRGMNKTAIVKQLWGYDGRLYQDGSRIYDQLLQGIPAYTVVSQG